MSSEYIALLNVITLIAFTMLFAFFYMKSVSPAALEKKIGEIAYKKCGQLRIISMFFLFLTIPNYIVYIFYPLPYEVFKSTLPWPWGLSFIFAVIIFVPSFYLMCLGLKDAGTESAVPKKEHTMYGGIYKKLRHPQGVGEAFLWFPLALILNSLFLTIYSFVWIPVFYFVLKAEEKDLIIRFGKEYEDYLEKTPFIISFKKEK